MSEPVIRFASALLPVVLSMAVLPSSPSLADESRPPSLNETKKAVAEYFAAGDDRKAELRRLFDSVPPLSRKATRQWVRVVKAAMARQVGREAKKAAPRSFRKFKRGGVFHVQAGGSKMKYYFRVGGKRGRSGYPLYINLHGGGAEKATNDSAWESAKGQYGVDGCLIVPRSTQDVALSWAVEEIWPLMDRLLAESFLLRNVDPDRVYVLGYSMGGWGTLLMGPAMADRWAAVGASAGGEQVQRAHAENLRNTPIIIQIGAQDHAFMRYGLSKAYAARLKELHEADKDGYVHKYKEHERAGHRISDGDTPKWLSQFKRNPYPEKVVWRPVGATRGHVKTFYYLAVDDPSGSVHIVVSRAGNRFMIEQASGVGVLTILLNDDFVDLDLPVVVVKDGDEAFNGKVERRLATLIETFEQRADRRLTFCAKVEIGP